MRLGAAQELLPYSHLGCCLSKMGCFLSIMICGDSYCGFGIRVGLALMSEGAFLTQKAPMLLILVLEVC